MALEGTWNGMSLRLHRVQAGLSIPGLVRRLAEEGLAINPSSVSRWEHPHGSGTARRPGDDVMVDTLARILGCSTIAFYRTPVLTYDTAESD